MILPNARRYARSRVWTWRYLACQSFELTLKTEDQKIIRELVQDPVLIISIHAALIALNYDSQSLVDQVIDVFANNRHIQQSLYAQLVTHPHPNFPKRVFERLNLEQDAYIKAFCYRLLTASTQGFKQSHQALLDAKAPLLELRIAALTYLATKEPDGAQDLLLSNLNDEHWEVRAISVKLLGTIGKPNNISALESGLNDPAWWVRLSTAEALLKLGPKGQAILDEQSNKKDKFSYDTAQSAIKKVRSADE